LFGDRLAEFERELRSLLRETSLAGGFAERVEDIGVVIWRP
jgi:hypothetical protein